MPFRRPAPTIVLTATIATTVILPLTMEPIEPIDSTPRSTPPSAAATRLAQQPLPGLRTGVTVAEVTQDEPFSMVALTAADLTGTSARVRAKHPDGSWGPWYRTAYETERPGGPSGQDGTDPVFVGSTTTVQIEVSRATGTPDAGPVETRAAEAPAPPGLGYLPATAEQPLAGDVAAVLISPPQAPVDAQWNLPAAVTGPGQPPNIIPRDHWGAPAANRCGSPAAGGPVRAAVVHHTAGSNDYTPQDSADIVRAVHAYHTSTLGWCDIGYNALVDKYGQVFEGRAGGITNSIMGSHAGGFNRDTWGVSMIGTFDDAPPPPIQVHTVGRLLGWRLGLDRTDPQGNAQLASTGGSYTHFPRGARLTLPVIISHRDVDDTDCPGDAGYAALDEIRDIAARFNAPPPPEELARSLEGGAIHAHWQQLGGMDSVLGAPTSPEGGADGQARYATFEHGAMYWSQATGAQPVTGAIYDAWASLGYERGALGLPTGAEFQEPEWVGQNFAHGTLNFNRASGAVTRVIDGIAEELPPTPLEGPPLQLERFSPVVGSDA